MLEYIVRPFQAPNAHGTIVIPSTSKPSTETAVLTWGGESTLPAVEFATVGFTTNKSSCKEDNTELKRDTETVRITGNDPENYIDVARSKKLYLDKKEDRDELENIINGHEQTDYAEEPPKKPPPKPEAPPKPDDGFGSFSPSAAFKADYGLSKHCAVTMALDNNTASGAGSSSSPTP